MPSDALVAIPSLKTADLRHIQMVFTDVDGTLTCQHRLRSSTVAALEALDAAGISTVLVTGRPSGWGECWARTLPVVGVIAENGGLYFARRQGHLHKVYFQPEAVRRRERAQLVKAVQRAIRRVRGAKLSMDSSATEVDIAIDYNEDVRLGAKAADQLEAYLREQGVTAVRSSVHVNCWLGRFDKLRAVKRFLSRERKTTWTPKDKRFVYVGDSFNDAPMFRSFPMSVGVANVLDILDQLEAPPSFVTSKREGRGFEELTQALLASRSAKSAPLKKNAI